MQGQRKKTSTTAANPRNTIVATILAMHFRRGYHVSLAQPTVWNMDHTPCVRWNHSAANQTR